MRDVGLVRWQDYAEMTDDLLDRLAREAIEEARGMAAAEGYFSAKIDVRIDRDVRPAAVTLAVDVGPATRIASVRIVVTGPAATDTPLGTDAIARLTRDWALPEGDVFRQAAWSIAKERALATLAASPYAAARMVRSEAAIDPAANRADLVVELASGPAFRFGRLEVSGLEKYDPSVVRNYSTIAPGEPYSEAELEPVCAKVERVGLLRERAGEDRPGGEGSAGRDGGHRRDRSAAQAARRRCRLLHGRAVSRQRELPRREFRRQRTSVRGRRPPRDQDPVGVGEVHAPAERRPLDRVVLRGRRAHGHREPRHAHGGRGDALAHGRGARRARALRDLLPRRAAARRVAADDRQCPLRGIRAALAARRRPRRADPGLHAERVRRIRRSGHLHALVRPAARARRRLGAAREGQRARPSRGRRRRARRQPQRQSRRRCCSAPAAARRCAATTSRAWASPRAAPSCRVATTRWRASMRSAGSTSSGGSRSSSTRATQSIRCPDAHLALGYGIGARIRTPLGPFRLDVAYGQDVRQVRVQFSVGLTF